MGGLEVTKYSFKQYLNEVRIENWSFSKDHSDSIAKSDDIRGRKWKVLPLKNPFPVKGFSIKYDREPLGFYGIAVIDDKTKNVAVYLDAKITKLKFSGGTITGLMTYQLSSAKEYRGQDLTVHLYDTLVANGQILISSANQTRGGASVWDRLVKQTKQHVLVGADVDDVALDHEIPENVVGNFSDVILTGTIDSLTAAVRGYRDSYWIITSDLGNLLKDSIKV